MRENLVWDYSYTGVFAPRTVREVEVTLLQSNVFYSLIDVLAKNG
jgi:hypothetical protein